MLRHILLACMFFISVLNACLAQQWQVYTTANSGLPDNRVGLPDLLAQNRSVTTDMDNNVWMMLGGDPITVAAKFNPATNEWKTLKPTDTPFSSNGADGFFSVYCDRKNNVWMSTYHSTTGEYLLYQYDGNQWTIAPALGAYDLAEDRDGNLWITEADVLVLYDGKKTTPKSFVVNGRQTPSAGMILYDIDFDRSNNFWSAYFQIGNPRHTGLVKYREGFLPVTYTTNSFISVMEIQDNDDVWIGTTSSPTSGAGFDPASGIARLNATGGWDRYGTLNSPLPNDIIYGLKSDATGRLWIATANGLARFDKASEWKVFTTQNSPLLSNVITGIAIDTVGNKWIGTLNGLVKFNEITPAFSHKADCFGKVTFQDQSASMEGTIKAWHWDFAGLGTSTGASPSFTFPAPGVYNVRLWMKDNKGNRNMITQKVTISTEPASLSLGKDIKTCQASAVIVADFGGADQYVWHTPSGTTQGTTTFTATRSGQYILEARMNDGCVLKDTVSVTINEGGGSVDFTMTSAGKDMNSGDVILKGIPITFTHNNTIQAPVTWWFGDNTIAAEAAPVHTYEQAGTYTIALTGAGSADCPVKTEKVITVQDIFIATAISPNGDGMNDKLHIEPFVYEAALKVVDRKGRTVYDAPSYHDDFTGQDLAEGVYFYELYFKEVDKRYKGVVHIIK